MTTPISSPATSDLLANYGVNSATTSLGAATSASQDQNTFLQLLVAQLQYQDPSNPTDGTQYMTEMAQFTQVETLQTIASQQQSQQQMTQVIAADSMLGRQVTGTGDSSQPVTGIVASVEPTSKGASVTLSDGTVLPVSAITNITTPTGT